MVIGGKPLVNPRPRAVTAFVAANFQHLPADKAYFSSAQWHGSGRGWASAFSWSIIPAGVDPFAAPGSAAGLSCRVYPSPDGLRGSPTLDDLRAVLDP